ncbi:hypothetical protein SS50377_21447 [Spironucleus salmonicida]|uniref:Uncharacterized protein n=1 Tax=Spironucleus salmonicida TaxID=348837 RepID=V6LFE8_9EUKA|nr:hypothetical protein SS50377_21447 [Spironucleus salmonicida]|eukprot:EST42431.1 Hypothetical protein SS50377_17989 [Spironucleus salmonicida]
MQSVNKTYLSHYRSQKQQNLVNVSIATLGKHVIDKLMIKQGLVIFWHTVLQGECMYRLKADQWNSWDLNRNGVNTQYCILNEPQVETCILLVGKQDLRSICANIQTKQYDTSQTSDTSVRIGAWIVPRALVRFGVAGMLLHIQASGQPRRSN